LLELFGGIGAPRQAFENLGVPIKSVDYVEVLQYAVKAYNNMFDHSYKAQDVRDWNMHIDVLIHGSPCQDFSKNGKNDISTGRSILYNRTLEIIEHELYPRPKVVIWENVPNLLSKRHRHHFEHYLTYMAKLGYTNKYAVLNANDYGIPQKRERLFVISILGENNFEFPQKIPMKNIKTFIDTNISFEHNRLRDNDLQLFFYDNNDFYLHVNSKRKYQRVRDFDIINVERPTSKTRRGRIIKGVQQAPTITTSKNLAVYYDNEIRYLTALEYWRLMGFSDEKYHSLIEAGIKEEMIIFLAGNSIVVPVLEEIYKEILKLNLF